MISGSTKRELPTTIMREAVMSSGTKGPRP